MFPFRRSRYPARRAATTPGAGGALSAVALLAPLSCTSAPAPPAPPPETPIIAMAPGDTSAIAAAAREVITEARYATLVTLDSDGTPQARIVDPFLPDDDFTIWIATNPRTRKVAEIARDPRVTLLYFDRDGASYVTVIGRAERVDDPAMKEKYWKTEWAAFYPEGHLGDDYLLIRVTARRLEVSAERLGVMNDPVTWRPAIVEFR